METSFLFMDESYTNTLNKNIKIVSLTGLVVNIEIYNKVRERFYELIKPFYVSKGDEGLIINHIPEIHGNDMLGEESTDEEKIVLFENISKLVKSAELPVYKVSYYLTPKLRKDFRNEENLLGLCWMGLLSVVQPVYENCYLVPIMDGICQKKVTRFSNMIQQIDSARSYDREDSLYIKNSKNIIGEVFFADSKYSVMTQVVDIVSYLRNVNDQKEEGIAFSNFKESVYGCNKYLSDNLKYDKVVELNKKVVDRLS